jgi:ketosteroid isomerase-like protein
MRDAMKRFVLVTGLMMSASVAHAGETAEGTVTGFHKALEQGDRAAALAALSDTVRIFEQGWVESSKAEYASHHLDSDIAFAKVVQNSTTDVDVQVDGMTAVVTRQGKTTGTFEGKPVDSIGLETMVLRKVDGDWKIVHIHWSSRKAK